jgi:hypothetical protein
MSESITKPTITGADGTVTIDIGESLYLKMSADMAEEFGKQILAAAARSEGSSGQIFIMEVPAI